MDINDPKEYTLVLDLDETLVHFNRKRLVYQVRPGCLEFLGELAKYYEIVIFTASVSSVADFIIDKLDPKKELVRHRLYRNHTILSKTAAVKDLARLGRPLERTLIVDNRAANFVR